MNKTKLFTCLFCMFLFWSNTTNATDVLPIFTEKDTPKLPMFPQRNRQQSAWKCPAYSKNMRHKQQSISTSNSPFMTEKFGFLQSPNGSDWLYTYNQDEQTWTFYDEKQNIVGIVKFNIESNRNITLFPYGQVTTNIFDNDASTYEFLFYEHEVLNSSIVIAKTIVYNNKGEKITEFDADNIDIISNKTTSYTRIITRKYDAQTHCDNYHIYKPIGSNNQHPLEYCTSIYTGGIIGATFYPYNIDEKIYYTISTYEKQFYTDEWNYNYDNEYLYVTPDNNFSVMVLNEQYDTVSTIKIPCERTNYYASYHYGINWLTDKDFSKGMYSGDDDFNFVITVDKYYNSSDEEKISFYVYNSQGKQIKTIDEEVDIENIVRLADINGHETQWAFGHTDASGNYSIRLVNIPSCTVAQTITEESIFPLSFNINRYATENSYQYIAAYSEQEMDEQDNKYSILGVFNADLSLNRKVKFNLGKNDVQTYFPLTATTLNPLLFDTDKEQEYVYLLQTTQGGKKETYLKVADHKGRTMAIYAGDEEKGEYVSAGFLNPTTENKTMYIGYYANSKYTLEFVPLPLKLPFKPVTNITLNKTNVELLPQETIQLRSTIAPEDATQQDLIWTSSSPNVASVDENGLVTAHLSGTATIITTDEKGTISATCEVEVLDPQFIYTIINDTSVSIAARNKSIDNVIIPETTVIARKKYDVTAITAGGFDSCSDLTSITIPNSVTTIGAYAFQNCVKLKEISLPNSITYIGGSAFLNCSGLTSINIPDKLTSLNSFVFAGLTSLPSITIPESVTTISNDVFSGCSSLTSIVIPDSVTTIGKGAFWNCSQLETITLGKSITAIDDYVFQGCNNLKKINYTGDVASWCAINFEGWYSNPIYYTHKLWINDAEIKQLIVPEGVTNVNYFAFLYCSNLTSVTLPASLSGIGKEAFYGCYNLTYITSRAITPPTTAYNTFGDVPIGAEVTVPCGAAPSYRVVTGWSGFTHIIEDLVYDFKVSVKDQTTGLVQTLQSPTCDLPAIIKALPMDGYKFQTWSDGNTLSMRQITVDRDIDLQALFVPADGSGNVTDVTVTPTDSTAAFTWPSVEGAASYTLIVWTDAEETERICSLTFDAAGRLTNLDFSKRNAPTKTTAAGFGLNFTVTGLEAGTKYGYSLDSKTSEGVVLNSKSGTFETIGETTSIEDIFIPTASDSVHKVIENGTIYILRNGEKYLVDGRKVE